MGDGGMVVSMDRTERLRELSRDPSRALEIGKAAEHLVCSDILLSGFQCFLSDQGLAYDACIDLDGRIIRIQIKGVCFARDMNVNGKTPRFGYTFYVRRRGRDGKGDRLSSEMCDIVALVALDRREIVYMPVDDARQTIQLACPDTPFDGKRKRTRPMPFFVQNTVEEVLKQIGVLDAGV